MRVNYGGKDFEFPDDASDDEIGSTLHSLGEDEFEHGAAAINMGRNSEALSVEEIDQLFAASNGEEMNFMKLNDQQKRFAQNIRTIETGGVDNPFIRTKAVGTGSSAYGPVQITKSLLESTLRTQPDMFTEEERAAMEDLVTRQKIALAVGGRDRAKYARGGVKMAQGAAWAKKYGFADVDSFLSAFDYGGDFGLSQDSQFQLHYESVAEKMLVAQLEETGGDELEAASRWHGGRGWKTASSRQQTDKYRQRYQKMS